MKFLNFIRLEGSRVWDSGFRVKGFVGGGDARTYPLDRSVASLFEVLFYTGHVGFLSCDSGMFRLCKPQISQLRVCGVGSRRTGLQGSV